MSTITGGFGGGGGVVTAADVSVTPVGNIEATNVQAAIEEIDTIIGDVETLLEEL